MTVALIDLDVLCYNACENRWRDSNGNRIVTLDYEEEDPQAIALFLEEAWGRLKELVENVIEQTFATSYRAAVGGVGNFRKDIFPNYKMNRHADPKKRNPYVPELRKRAVAEGMATAADGMEADDLLCMWAAELRKKEEPYTVASIDKDLLMIPGTHYRIHKKDLVEMSENEAMRFYFEQLIKGDSTDNISGVPGVGPVKATKFLAGCKTREEMQLITASCYYTAFGSKWKENLLLNGQLIYLKQSMDDWFNLEGWPGEENLTYIDGVKRLEEMTLELALEAINPSNVVGTKRWDAAMLFIAEELGDNYEMFNAIETLSNRNKIPKEELEAYAVLRSHFEMKGNPIVVKTRKDLEEFKATTPPPVLKQAIPQSFVEAAKVIPPAITAPPKFTFKVPAKQTESDKPTVQEKPAAVIEAKPIVEEKLKPTAPPPKFVFKK